jgi:hypothetical protein
MKKREEENIQLNKKKLKKKEIFEIKRRKIIK